MNVKRYDPKLEKDGGLGMPSMTMQARIAGSFVSYSDYEQLAAERDAVNAGNAYLRDQVICWARECDRITFTYTNKVTDAHQMEAEQELANTVPATDAILASLRAEHLQSYADSIAARMKDKSLSLRQKERLNFAWAEIKAYAAELHNAQLRSKSEVQHD